MASVSFPSSFPYRAWAPVVLAAGLLALGGCNTVQGVGRDIQAGGRAISGAGAGTSQAISRATVADPAPATATADDLQPERRPTPATTGNASY